jgi:hypothetical protein
MFFHGFADELCKLAAEKRRKKKSFIRKAGPGLGALAGLATALATKGKILPAVGTGATVGWVPDIAASLKEAIKGE